MKLGSNRIPMTRPEQVLSFIRGGAAIFTIKSRVSGKHFSYKVKTKDDVLFVMALGAEAKWHFLGHIRDEAFKKQRAIVKYTARYPALEAFKWFWDILLKGRIPQDVDVFHEGRCSMCGRKLTDPISIQEGVGPECRNKKLQRGFRHDTLIK